MAGNPGYSQNRRIGSARAKEITVISDFTSGYRNREDFTLLNAKTLIPPSVNVLTNVSGRVGNRKGYTVDGATSNNNLPILSSFDWPMHVNGITQHLRAGFLSSAGNDGKLQFRYINSSGNVIWTDLMTGLTSVRFNFADYWNSTNIQAYLLFVNGTANIYEWSGGMGTIASVTTNTIILNGTEEPGQLGFYTASGGLTINGNNYSYSGTTTTGFTGVSPSPIAEPVNSLVFQQVKTTPNSDCTDLPDQNNDLIAVLKNQMYIGCLTSSNVYVSKVNNAYDFSYTVAGRLVGEGALLTLDGATVAFAPQEDQMYISAGKDQWYLTVFTLSADLGSETLAINPLKTVSLQAAQSQGGVTKIQNDILFLSNEPIVDTLGRVNNVVLTPQITDISFPIVNDMNGYDFTDAHLLYLKQFVYLTIPKEGILRIYNLTNPKNPYWEAPQTIPVGCLSVIDGKLYGHSYATSESYELFNGYADRATSPSTGNPYFANAVFAFQDEGIKNGSKSYNKFQVQGYITPNTTLTVENSFLMPSNGTTVNQTLIINGNAPYVLSQTNDNSLGKFSLGSSSLGGDQVFVGQNALPPYFANIKTMPRSPYFYYSPAFSSYGVNQVWQLLGYGNNATPTSEIDSFIYDDGTPPTPQVEPTGSLWDSGTFPWQLLAPWTTL